MGFVLNEQHGVGGKAGWKRTLSFLASRYFRYAVEHACKCAACSLHFLFNNNKSLPIFPLCHALYAHEMIRFTCCEASVASLVQLREDDENVLSSVIFGAAFLSSHRQMEIVEKPIPWILPLPLI